MELVRALVRMTHRRLPSASVPAVWMALLVMVAATGCTGGDDTPKADAPQSSAPAPGSTRFTGALWGDVGWELLRQGADDGHSFVAHRAACVPDPSSDPAGWCLLSKPLSTVEYYDETLDNPQGVISFGKSDHPVAADCVTSQWCITDSQDGTYVYDGRTWAKRSPDHLGHPVCANLGMCFSGQVLETDADQILSTYDHGTVTRSTWSKEAGHRLKNSPWSFDCSIPDFCLSISTVGEVVLWNGTKWSTSRSVDALPESYFSVSCGTGGFCMAIDDESGAVYTAHNGGPQPLPDAPVITAPTVTVGCGSPTLCLVAVGQHDGWLYDGDTWKAMEFPPVRAVEAHGVECVSDLYCIVLAAPNGDATSWVFTPPKT